MSLESKKELEILKREDRKRKKKSNFRWIITITISAFIISLFFSFISETVIPHDKLGWGILIALIFIIIGIIFDIIGVAITSAEEDPFHSMSSSKVKGAKIAVKLIKNTSKVSSFCNDVIGDICGIISGSAGIFIATTISSKWHFNLSITTLLVTAVIAALTIGGKALGKALGKTVAINRSDVIIYKVSKILALFKK